MSDMKKYVFRRCEDAPHYDVEHCGGGLGALKIITVLGDEPKMPVRCNPNDSENFHYMHLTTMPIGATMGEHVHEGSEQFYLFVEGKGEVTLCGDKFEVGPWDLALLKNGGSHGLKNTGDIPLKYICCEVEIKNEK